MKPKITVVIPVYNVESYLQECLDSVVGQTYKNIEMIVIDDGSTDHSGMICDEYAAKDDRMIVVHQENEGVSAARNVGIHLSKGNWVTFVDPDDWLELNYYEKMIEQIRGAQMDVFCSGGAFFEYQQRTQVRRRIKKNFYYAGADYEKERSAILAKVLLGSISDDILQDGMLFDMIWNNFYRTEFIKEQGLSFYLRLHPFEDTLFNYKVFDRAVFVGGSQVIGYHYRQTNATSVTKRFQADAFQQLCVFLKELDTYRTISIQGPSKLIDDALAARFLGEFMRCMKNSVFHADAGMTYAQSAAALKRIKREPLVEQMIHRRSNAFLNLTNMILKYLLRLPWIWTLKLSVDIKRWLKR